MKYTTRLLKLSAASALSLLIVGCSTNCHQPMAQTGHHHQIRHYNMQRHHPVKTIVKQRHHFPPSHGHARTYTVKRPVEHVFTAQQPKQQINIAHRQPVYGNTHHKPNAAITQVASRPTQHTKIHAYANHSAVEDRTQSYATAPNKNPIAVRRPVKHIHVAKR